MRALPRVVPVAVVGARIARSLGAALSTLALTVLAPATAGAQGGRVRVSYDVEFRTTGPMLDQNCTATGTDVLSGTLVGLEPPLPNEDNVYVGTLGRMTQISVCGSRTTATGEDVVCTISITGNGFADVMLTVDFDRRGGWLQYIANRGAWSAYLPPAPVGRVSSRVTGTCDPAELAQLQRDYVTGATAGSPNGQPIEVPALPPSGYPFTFAANPPESIWTLTVLARRP